MFRRVWPLLLIFGCTVPQDVSSSLAQLYDRYLEERAEADPNWATEVGLHQHDGRLTRYADTSHAARVALVDKYIGLVTEDSLDARLWRSELLSEQFEYRRRDSRRDLTPSLLDSP